MFGVRTKRWVLSSEMPAYLSTRTGQGRCRLFFERGRLGRTARSHIGCYSALVSRWLRRSTQHKMLSSCTASLQTMSGVLDGNTQTSSLRCRSWLCEWAGGLRSLPWSGAFGPQPLFLGAVKGGWQLQAPFYVYAEHISTSLFACTSPECHASVQTPFRRRE